MSSGDPLVDEDAHRLEALNNMLDSLSSKDSLVLEAAVPTIANGDDPLVDADEAARKKRDDLINSLGGKGKSLEAVDADDPLVAQDNQRESERDQLIQALQDKGDSLLAQQSPEAKTVEEALQQMNAFADANPDAAANTDLDVARRVAEADSADRIKWQRMEASGTNRRMEANDPAVKTGATGFGLPDLTSWFKSSGKNEEEKDRQLSAAEADAADRRRALEADEQDRTRLRLDADEADKKKHEAGRRMEADDPSTATGTNGFGLPDLSSWSNWFKNGDKKDGEGPTDQQLSAAGTNEADRRPGGIMLESDAANRRVHRLEADDSNRHHRSLGANAADNSLKAALHVSHIAPRQLAASGHSAHADALDIPQMFGGAFILVAVLALVAVVRRRRKPSAAPEPVDMDRSGDYDYQLFL